MPEAEPPTPPSPRPDGRFYVLKNLSGNGDCRIVLRRGELEGTDRVRVREQGEEFILTLGRTAARTPEEALTILAAARMNKIRRLQHCIDRLQNRSTPAVAARTLAKLRAWK